MTDEKNREEVAEKREKPPRRLRVAKCLHCSNEWRARNGNEKKPSKCPECGTRAVVWRDEYTPDLSMNPEDNTITDGITERKTENTTEQNREEPRKTENFEDYEEEEAGFILPDGSGVAFGVVGEPENNREEEEEKPTLEGITEKMKNSINPMFVVWIIGGLGLFALFLFLVRKAKNRHSVRPVTHPVEEPPTVEFTPRYRSAF